MFSQLEEELSGEDDKTFIQSKQESSDENEKERENSSFKSLTTIEICRICLGNGQISIFSSDDILKNVVEFGDIEMIEDDKLPKHLCADCQTLLEAAVTFRKTAKHSEQLLRGNNTLYGSYKEDISELLTRLQRNRKIKHSVLDSSLKSDPDWAALSDAQSSKADTFTEKEFLIVNYNSDSEEEEMEDLSTKNDAYMVIVDDKNKLCNDLKCDICNIVFNNLEDLNHHNVMIHNILIPTFLKCDICSDVVKNDLFKVHMTLHREIYHKNKKKTKKKVECEICCKKVGQTYYKYHLKMHGSDIDKAGRTRYCELCKKSVNVNYYSAHFKRVHKRTVYGDQIDEEVDLDNQIRILCPVCDKNILATNYKDHLANHGKPPKKYICEQCGFETIYPSAFKTHTLTHGGELKHKCQFCPYKATHQALLKIHVRTHTGDYNYRCTECPARFITKSNLSLHLKRHKGEGTIKCKECDRMFYVRRNMEKHYKTKHLKIRDHTCDMCGKSFSHRDGMLSHQIKAHNRKRLIESAGRLPVYLQIENND